MMTLIDSIKKVGKKVNNFPGLSTFRCPVLHVPLNTLLQCKD